MKKWLSYFLVSVLFWFVVDFTTTKAIKNPVAYYSAYMPLMLIFYVGYPLIFTFLIYRLKLAGLWLFILVALGAFVVEVIFTHNPLLLNFPLMLIGIPAALCIYSLLTYIPKWIIDSEISMNKWKITALVVVYVLISLASVAGN
jgi:hypothetical protein